MLNRRKLISAMAAGLSAGMVVGPTAFAQSLSYTGAPVNPKPGRLDFTTFGGIPGADDNGAAFEAFMNLISSGVPGIVQDGVFNVKREIFVADGSKLDLLVAANAELRFPEADLEFGGIVIGTDMGGFIEMPALAAPASVDDMSIVLASPPDLEPGDLVIVCNDTDFSWNDAREYYRAGDYCRVVSVDGSTVHLDYPLFDDYTPGSNIHVYKVNSSVVNIDIQGKLVGSTLSGHSTSGLLIRNARDSRIHVNKAENIKRAVVDLRHCYQTTATMNCNDYTVFSSLNYGVSMMGCFATHVPDSKIRTTRHAVTITGGGIGASIPNRFCTASNSTLNGGFIAADMHGHAEYCSFYENDILGGVQLGGAHSSLIGGTVTSNTSETDFTGLCFRLREPRDANHKVSGTRFICNVPLANSAQAILEMDVGGAELTGHVELTDLYFQNDANASIAALVADSDPEDIKHITVTARGLTCVNQNGNSPNLRIEGADTARFASIVLQGLTGLAPRLIDVRSKYIRIHDLFGERSANDGIHVNLEQDDEKQVVEISSIYTAYNQSAGISILGAGAAQDVEIYLDGNKSLDNGQNGATPNANKTSVRVIGVGLLSMMDNRVGDRQGSPTQLTTVDLVNVTKWVDVNNEQVISALSSATSGVTTHTTSIPSL